MNDYIIYIMYTLYTYQDIPVNHWRVFNVTIEESKLYKKIIYLFLLELHNLTKDLKDIDLTGSYCVSVRTECNGKNVLPYCYRIERNLIWDHPIKYMLK